MPGRRTLRILAAALVLGGVGVRVLAGDEGGSATPPTGASDRPDGGYVEAFARGDYEGARRELERLVEADPTNKFLMYNLACAEAMAGARDEAVESLLDALSLGYVDFHHMVRDEHLAPIREHPRFRTIVRNWRLVLDTRAEAELEAMRGVFGEREYTFEKDGEKRITWTSGFRADAFASAREEAGRVHAWAAPLFDEPRADEARPPAWVHVVLPTTEDFIRMVGAGRVGGYYDKDNKRLVSRDIGPSLRHEFFHVLHWRHMDRVGQVHPIWLQEGLASVVEDIEARGEEGLVVRPSWRTNIAKRLAEFGRLTDWERLFSMEHSDFVGRRPRANYAQARAVVMFLHERGLLEAWYEAYVAGFDEDPTGLAAMETVFERPVAEVEREYRKWLIGLEAVADIDRPGATLGVALSQGRGDGPMVDEIVAMNEPGVGGEVGNRLRHRDVIVAIDGKTVRTLDDLYRVLGEYEVGEEVVVTVVRGRVRREVPVALVEPE